MKRVAAAAQTVLHKCRILRPHFTSKALLFAVVEIAIPCAWLGNEMNKAAARASLDAAVTAAQGETYPNYDMDAGHLMTYGIFTNDEERPWLTRVLDDESYAPTRVVKLWGDTYIIPPLWAPTLSGIAETQAKRFLPELSEARIANEIHVLFAGWTDIDDSSMAIIARFEELRVLDVASDGVTAEGIRQLAGHPKLEQLFVKRECMSLEVAADLFRTCPRLEHITWGAFSESWDCDCATNCWTRSMMD